MENKKTIYSTHTFMLPLRWDYLPKGYSNKTGKGQFSFDQRTELKQINEYLLQENSYWTRKFYRINGKDINYNELTYFHAFATKSLFDLQQPDEVDEKRVNDKKVMLYYECKLVNDKSTFIITSNKGVFTLKIEKIALRVFNTGIAIISYHLLNEVCSDKEDILAINEFGRRIYPQFLEGTENATNRVKDVFHPKSISLKLTNDKPFEEKFEHYDDLKELETHGFISMDIDYKFRAVVQIPNYIKELFNKDNFVFDANSESWEKIRFNLLADDRMFFQCWYGDNGVASLLATENKKSLFPILQTVKKKYLNSPFWYAFIFGDRSSKNLGVANQSVQEQNIEAATYTRWSDYGTLYGFSRDSFVAISQDIETLKKQRAPNICEHMQTMYYRMAILSLAQRASVLRFSAEVTDLADLGKQKDKNVLERIKDLHLNYIEFINKLYFREITSQIQGIEMYNQFQCVMRIADDVKDLDGEVKELYNYAEILKQNDLANETNKLTKVATIFLPIALLVSILAFFSDKVSFRFETWWGISENLASAFVLLVLISMVVIAFLFRKMIYKIILKMIDKIDQNKTN